MGTKTEISLDQRADGPLSWHGAWPGAAMWR